MTVQMPHQRDRNLRAALGKLADDIEAEMRRLGIWSDQPPTDEDVLADGGAFGQRNVAFVTWVQVVLVARLRAVAAGDLDPPTSSMVGTQAIREWDGVPEYEQLSSLLARVDGTILRGGDPAPRLASP
jgi:uncharacterized protein YqcC (DUF446 family)